MENDLLGVITGTESLKLEDVIPQDTEKKVKAPEASIRNHAALTALLSDDPNKVIQNYQNIISETQSGVSYTRDGIMGKVRQKQTIDDNKALMSVLADPSIPLEQKKEAIRNINSDFNKDTSTIIAMEAAKEPSGNETVEGENVRIIGAEQYKGIREAKELKQKILNGKLAKLDSSFGSLFTGAAEQTLAPFGVNIESATVLREVAKVLGIEKSKVGSFAFPGYMIEDIRERLASIPPQDRVKVHEKISDIIFNSKDIIFMRDNDFAKMQIANVIFGDEYSNFEKFLDNTSGILDVIGVGALAKAGVRKLTSLFTKTPENIKANVELRDIVPTVSPVSPVKTLEDTNPAKAKALYTAAVTSKNDEVAKAVSGASKEDLVADMNLPQPMTSDGSVVSKLVTPERTIIPEQEIVREASDTGAIYFSEQEKMAVMDKTIQALNNATGLVIHDNMSTVGQLGGKQVLRGLYGTSEGGFLKAEEAVDQAKFALKEFGITEKDISLFKKIEDEYVPISLEEARKVDGDYLVSVNLERNINADDIVEFGEETAKWNLLDRIPAFRSNKAGTLSNTLMSHASMLSERYTGSAAVAFDKAVRLDKLFLKMHSKFSDEFMKLPEVRKQKVYDYIKEANALELDLDHNQLFARGFVKKEIDILDQWKKNWDTHFYFENQDLVRSLTHQGFKILENGSTGDKLYAKPIGKNTKVNEAYDPSTGGVVRLTNKEVEDLYNTGGSYAIFKRPIDINGNAVEHMVVRNTPNEYLRSIRDYDQILNYRKGYYQVAYEAPKIVEQIIRNANGAEIYRKAVGLAGSTKEAEQLSKRLSTNSGVSADDFKVRDDLKQLYTDTDAYWDLHNSSGRIAQRHRGQRLEEFNSSIQSFDGRYILDPTESAIRAARSLSRRIATRDMIEASKARAMAQYSEFFPQGKWVENSNSLVAPSTATSKRIGDARTTVEYLNYLTHGYTNGFDDGFKQSMSMIANILSNKSEAGEKMFLWMGSGSPTQAMKSGVFQAYISLNPLRQAVIQSHQTVRLLGYEPLYIGSGKAMLDGEKYFRYASGLSDISIASKSDREMVEFIQKSGMLDAVDKHNLVRGSLTDLAESGNATKRIVGKTLAVPRKIGFDMGEQANLAMHLLAVRNRYLREGKNLLDPAVRDEAYSVARAISYDMNFAGDMPYNQNALGLFMQFFQVPHKAILAYSNRRISANDRFKFFIADAALFGVPGAAVISNMIGEDVLPSDPKAREATLFGLTSLSYNTILSNLAGKDIKVDFSSLAPYNYEGFAHLLHAITSGGGLEFVQNSPAFSLYFKDNSKFQEAFGRMFRYFGHIDVKEGLEKEDLMSVMKGVAEISSGWSNAYKAYLIHESGKIVDKKTGKPIMNDTDSMYALAQLFGFKSQKEVFEWAAIKDMNENKKSLEEDWQKVYNNYISVLTRDGKVALTDPESIEKVLGMVKKVYAGDPKAQEWFYKKLSQDMVDRQDVIVRKAIESALYKDGRPLTDVQNLGNLGDEDYNKMKRLFDDMRTQIKNFKEEE